MANKILGKFELLEELGRGGFGTVYRARDTSLDLVRAVKVLHSILVTSPDFIERFRREARIAARLEHPNIVPVYEFGEVRGSYFLVMKFMPGGSLKDVLAKEGRLPFTRALEITCQIAGALEYAHAQPERLIHRDIKPGNILFEADPLAGTGGAARLADFGFAKALAGDDSSLLSGSGGMIGTPMYMAPEIWDGKPAVPATDQYALACVLYETLTGKVLFPGDSPMAVMKQHANGWKRPEKWPEGVPNGIENVLGKALNEEPLERYLSISEFVSALKQLTSVDTILTQMEGKTIRHDKSASEPVHPITNHKEIQEKADEGQEIVLPGSQVEMAQTVQQSDERLTSLGADILTKPQEMHAQIASVEKTVLPIYVQEKMQEKIGEVQEPIQSSKDAEPPNTASQPEEAVPSSSPDTLPQPVEISSQTTLEVSAAIRSSAQEEIQVKVGNVQEPTQLASEVETPPIISLPEDIVSDLAEDKMPLAPHSHTESGNHPGVIKPKRRFPVWAILGIILAIIAGICVLIQLFNHPASTFSAALQTQTACNSIVTQIFPTELKTPVMFGVNSALAESFLEQQCTLLPMSKVVYSIDREDPAPTPGMMSFAYEGIYVSNNGTASKDDIRISDLGGNRSPEWSPDSLQIAYIHVSDNFQTSYIRVTNPEGHATRTIEGNYSASSLNGLSWSPDGKMLAFTDDVRKAVVIIDLETENIFTVASKVGEDISWSPDGQKIAFWVREGVDGNDADGWVIYLVNIDGSGLIRVTNPSDSRGDMGPLLWTVNGQFLSYNSFKLDSQGDRSDYEIRIVDRDGNNIKTLSTPIEVVNQSYYPWIRSLNP